MERKELEFFFEKPEKIPGRILDEIYQLILKGKAVGTSYIKDNLQNAFLIAYATDQGRVVGTVTLKRPKEAYRRKIEAATGLNLTGYLERGYHSVEEGYRGRGIADRLIKGLVERSSDRSVYVTISMDNLPPLRLAERNRMSLAATFINERTGRKIGVFTNRREGGRRGRKRFQKR